MKDKVKQVLGTILEKFKSGDIPEAVAYFRVEMGGYPPKAPTEPYERD
jgi:hypothetical protein